MRIASVGHALFAATLIALGIYGLISGKFAPIFDEVPKAFLTREALVYLCAAVTLLCGSGLLFQRTAGTASRVLFAYFVLWMVLFKVPQIVQAPLVEGTYQNWGEIAVLLAASWVLYAWFAGAWDRRQLSFATGDEGVRLARAVYGLALIAFGLSHYAYLELTAPLVPAWLPWHVGWAYFTGATYLAGGVAILIGVYARLAAALSVLQIGLFTVLVWTPLMAAGVITPGQREEFVYSWALTAAAWVVADSYRGAPWLAATLRRRGTPFA
ncbi:MAG TPA: hypothetical protein VMU52_09335 [Steroidobacteraceae bacterium]|nr:hypothetical protein [Steroidobacteraceae bacterium]